MNPEEFLTPLTVSVSLTALSAAAICYLLQSNGKKLSANPFQQDTREDARPHVTDKLKRDSVLKNGYSSKKLSMIGNDFDAIIIGSGPKINYWSSLLFLLTHL
jgi:hypothetical protein